MFMLYGSLYQNLLLPLKSISKCTFGTHSGRACGDIDKGIQDVGLVFWQFQIQNNSLFGQWRYSSTAAVRDDAKTETLYYQSAKEVLYLTVAVFSNSVFTHMQGPNGVMASFYSCTEPFTHSQLMQFSSVMSNIYLCCERLRQKLHNFYFLSILSCHVCFDQKFIFPIKT